MITPGVRHLSRLMLVKLIDDADRLHKLAKGLVRQVFDTKALRTTNVNTPLSPGPPVACGNSEYNHEQAVPILRSWTKLAISSRHIVREARRSLLPMASPF